MAQGRTGITRRFLRWSGGVLALLRAGGFGCGGAAEDGESRRQGGDAGVVEGESLSPRDGSMASNGEGSEGDVGEKAGSVSEGVGLAEAAGGVTGTPPDRAGAAGVTAQAAAGDGGESGVGGVAAVGGSVSEGGGSSVGGGAAAEGPVQLVDSVDTLGMRCTGDNNCNDGSICAAELCVINPAPCSGTFIVRSDADLAALADCTGIRGNLEIRVPGPSSLEGLKQLTAIAGDLRVAGTETLSSLRGLENLTHVGGEVRIGLEYDRHDILGGSAGNSALTSLAGLDALSVIGSGLGIVDNDRLTQADGLPALSLVGDLYISENDVLTAVGGFYQLTHVRGTVGFGDNPMLDDLGGLKNLQQVDGGLSFSNNASLTSLHGLEQVVDVGGSVVLSASHALRDLTGLAGLVVAGGLEVGPADQLVSLNGLDSLTLLKGDLSFRYLPVLTDISALSGLQALDGTLEAWTTESLPNLDGLEGISAIGGGIHLVANEQLASLAGLGNVTSLGQVPGLYYSDDAEFSVTHNPLLPECQIQELIARLRDFEGLFQTRLNDESTPCE